jgi:hypothetical protein
MKIKMAICASNNSLSYTYIIVLQVYCLLHWVTRHGRISAAARFARFHNIGHGLNPDRFMIMFIKIIFNRRNHERNAMDYRICRYLSVGADLYSAQNGNFHLNAGCLSGGRQKKWLGTDHKYNGLPSAFRK